jgi:hypothetical protein
LKKKKKPGINSPPALVSGARNMLSWQDWFRAELHIILLYDPWEPPFRHHIPSLMMNTYITAHIYNTASRAQQTKPFFIFSPIFCWSVINKPLKSDLAINMAMY